jgi:lipid II:glycine glycyltransferase (peptidoglycan interpeptide bridge formation enzyme)
MITNLSKSAWDQKTIELGGSILQSWVWGQFHESLGARIHRFSGNNFACLVIEETLPLGKKYIYSPRGPVGEAQSALADFKQLESDRNLVFARLEPYQKLDLPPAIKHPQPKENWILNLEKSEEELLIGMKPKTRYNINLALRKGVTVREGNQSDLLAFYQLMLETAARAGIRLHTQQYYFKMWDALAPGHIKLLLASYQGQILAGMLLTVYGSTATYLHGGSSQKMKEAMAPYLMHWEAIRLAKSLGATTYDFGGIAPNGDQAHAWSGITRFKKGFGGVEVVYPGAFDLVFSPIWYNVYKQGRKLSRVLKTHK